MAIGDKAFHMSDAKAYGRQAHASRVLAKRATLSGGSAKSQGAMFMKKQARHFAAKAAASKAMAHNVNPHSGHKVTLH